MSTRGVVVAEKQVTMLARIVAVSEHPVLDVTSLSRWDSVTSKAELVCHARAECLPFYVFITWPDKQFAAAALDAFRTPVCSPACPHAVGHMAAPRSEPLPVTIRAGAHTILLIDQDGLHIRVPVICLENGSPGKVIRVEGRDRKQTYLAEVLTDNSLKGAL